MPDLVPSPCFITGGHGFIGRAVVRAMTARGWRVRLGLRRPMRTHLSSRYSEHAWSLDDPVDASTVLQGCTTALHLAARVHVLHDTAEPLAAYLAVNTAGTLHLAEQAASAGVRRFVFVSTVKVHGESTSVHRPVAETTAPAPQDPYAISKWEAEQGLATIAARTGMEVVIVRPPLVYGPGVKANFAALVNAVARGWPLPLAGIDNRRSLIGLDNLVDFLLLCLEHPAAANQTLLVSDGEDLSTPSLLRRLGTAMGRPARLWAVPPALLTAGAALIGRRAAAERLCGNLQLDSTKARTLMNWSPPVGVDESLRRTVRGLAV